MFLESIFDGIESAILKRPRLRNILFREKVKTQEFLSSILETKIFNGSSFVQRDICLSIKPTRDEIKFYFDNICSQVEEFLNLLSQRKPTLHEIPKTNIMFEKNVIAIKAMVTLYEDLYLVTAVFLLQKNEDETWSIVKSNPYNSIFESDTKTTRYKEYPESIHFSFCGGFGDVNYVEEKEFDYKYDCFFAF